MTVEYLDRATLGLPPTGTLHKQWGVKKGLPRKILHSQVTRLNVHHTVFIMSDYDRDGFLHGDKDDIARYMRRLMTIRRDLGPEVPYSFAIFEGADPDSAFVAEGRGFGYTGAHTIGENSTSYGVAIAGNTSTRDITLGMEEAIRWVGRQLHDPLSARKTLGHRDHKQTECPGNSAYAALPRLQPPFTAQEDELDPEIVRKINELHAELVESNKGKVKYMVQQMNHEITQLGNDTKPTLRRWVKKIWNKHYE